MASFSLRRPAAIQYYRYVLTTGEDFRVQQAVTRLCDLQAVSAIPDLIELIRQDAPHFEGRLDLHFAVDHMKRLGREAAPRLIEALKTNSEFVRRNVCKIIEGSVAIRESPQLASALARLLWHPDARWSAAYLFQSVDANRAESIVHLALYDAQPAVQRAALRVLGVTPDLAKRFQNRVVELMESSDPANRAEAVQTASSMTSSVVVDAVIKRLEDSDEFVIKSAVRSLGRIKPRQAVKHLVRRLEKTEGFGCDEIAEIPTGIEALGRLLCVPRDSPEIDKKILWNFRYQSVTRLGSVISSVSRCLENQNSKVRELAARVLEHAGAIAATSAPALRSALEREPPQTDCWKALVSALAAVEGR